MISMYTLTLLPEYGHWSGPERNAQFWDMAFWIRRAATAHRLRDCHEVAAPGGVVSPTRAQRPVRATERPLDAARRSGWVSLPTPTSALTAQKSLPCPGPSLRLPFRRI